MGFLQTYFPTFTRAGSSAVSAVQHSPSTFGKVMSWDVGAAAVNGTKALGGGMKTVAKGTGKLALAGLAVVGGLYAASSLVSSFRDKNEYKEPERPDPYADLPPMPPVYDMGGPQQETMMGLAPVTDGKFAQQEMSRRGMQQGIGSPQVG